MTSATAARDMSAPPAATPRFARLSWGPVLAIVWIVSAAYVLAYLDHGWIPHDEGTLAHSAERVLQGDMPHRDFDEVYTGGLSYVNALAFRVLGVDLMSLRVVAFVVFLLWVPALYYVALRLASPVVAGAAVLLCAAWSLPNYAAPMPSWYNLFLATFGTAALFRYLDVRRGRWLAVAGLCAGLSCLVKVVGLYFVAAALLFLVYEEQSRSATAAPPGWRRDLVYSAFVSTALLGFVGVLLALVRRNLRVEELFHFVVPGALLAFHLLQREWGVARGAGSLTRARRLATLLAPFVAGLAVPLVAFVWMYARNDAVGALVEGVFVKPSERLSHAARRPFPLITVAAALPNLLLLGVVPWRRLAEQRLAPAVALLHGAVLGALLLLSGNEVASALGWFMITPLVPLTVACGVAWLGGRDMVGSAQPRTFLLLSVAALGSLVQFPFSAVVYFFYAAPLAVLALLAVARVRRRHATTGATAGSGVVYAFFLLFAVVHSNPTLVWKMTRTQPADLPPVRLASARASIDVRRSDAATYEGVVRALRDHARGGYTLATPDSPEVYYLAGLRNPTRTLFDFFDRPERRTARVLAALDAHAVTAVVVNTRPGFSGPLPPALARALAVRYPSHQTIGHFVVRWR